MNKPIIIIISIPLVLLFVIFYLFPSYQELMRLEKVIEVREEELSMREESIRELKNIEAKLKIYQEELAKIDSAMPADVDLPALFDFIQKAGSQSGLALKSVSHSAVRPLSGFEGLGETEASLTLSGAYDSFKKFLKEHLELTDRMIEAQSVSFSSNPDDGPDEFKLTIKVYSYQE